MPATATRTCPHPDHTGERTLPFTADNFYIRPNGSADYWCRECVRRYNRQQRAARRANGITRKFGVEIEYIGDYASLEREMRARGLVCAYEGYNHQVRSGWKIVRDASVYSGYELVSPPLKGRNGFQQLEKACEALRAAGASVNTNCGLHVHHDVTDMDTRAFGRMVRAWSNNQANTDGLVAASRRNCQWAMPLAAIEVLRAEQLTSMDRHTVARNFTTRYRSLNCAAFGRQGTVEVRQHQGTLNFRKIAAWVRFGQAFCTWAKGDQGVDSELTTDALLDRLGRNGLAADDVTYLKARAAHFATRSGRRSTMAVA